MKLFSNAAIVILRSHMPKYTSTTSAQIANLVNERHEISTQAHFNGYQSIKEVHKRMKTKKKVHFHKVRIAVVH
jgi:hypothetical protein